MVSGGEFNQEVAPLKDGTGPSMDGAAAAGSAPAGATPAAAPAMEFGGVIRSSSDCSSRLVPASDRPLRKLVSTPNAIATTPHSTATPKVRRTHSPAPSERFIAANTRPPARMAIPNEVAAPAA